MFATTSVGNKLFFRGCVHNMSLSFGGSLDDAFPLAPPDRSHSAVAQKAALGPRDANFLITINPNKKIADDDIRDFTRDMQLLARDLFGSVDQIQQVLKRSGGGPLTRTELSLVRSVTAEGEVEIGAIQHRAHQHIHVTVSHEIKGKGIHIDRDKLLKYYQRNLPAKWGIKGIHIDIQGYPTREDRLAYIRKQRRLAPK